MKWSILVPMMPQRFRDFHPGLFGKLEIQAQPYRSEVEVLGLVDTNRRFTIGMKRNKLIDIAQGEYISFLDDDDDITDDFVESIMAVLRTRSPSVVCFDFEFFDNGEGPRIVKYTKDVTGEPWTFLPSPQHIWRRELVVAAGGYSDMNWKEDDDFRIRMKPHIIDEAQVGKALYRYLYNPKTTLSR